MTNLKDFTARELTSKHANLMDDIEKLPPGAKISPQILKKKVAFEKELQRRLYSLLIGDVLPIIPAATKIIEEKIMIVFNFEVMSELNTLIDRFKIDAPTKGDAWEEARKKAKSYPGQVHLKIS